MHTPKGVSGAATMRRRWLSHFTNLRARLFLLVLLALLPTLGLLMYNHFEQRERAADDAREEALQITRLGAAQGDLATEQGRQLLVGLSRLEEVRSDEHAGCNILFTDLLGQFPLYANLGVVSRTGDLECSGVPVTAPVNAADRVWFQRSVESRDFAVGEYIIGRVTGLASLTIAYPLLDAEGAVSKVVFASIDLRYLDALASGSALPEDSAVVVTDRTGVVLSRFPSEGDWVGQSAVDVPLVQAMLSQGTGTIDAKGLDGKERLYGYAPLVRDADVGAYLAIGLSPEAAYAAADASLVRNLALVIGVAALALLLAAVGAELFLLRQVNALGAAARRLAEGDLTARADIDGSNEIGQLGRTFDEMAQALQRREDETTAARGELEATADHLRRTNADLEAFTYSVSHDLKEPLRGIEAFSQFLLEDYHDTLDEQGRDYLRKVANASARMKRLIEELLTLSRLGRNAANRERIDVARVLQDVCEGLRSSIEEKNATIEVAADLPPVLGDAAHIEQIFGNLVANAIKFNRSERPLVRVGWAEHGDGQLAFSVADNGIGIEAQYHERIFGVFQRLHRREEFEGTGAGLAIVKRAVEALGGALWLESQPGQGTTFHFTLPRADDGAALRKAA